MPRVPLLLYGIFLGLAGLALQLLAIVALVLTVVTSLPPPVRFLTVVLTAFNDEQSVGQAVDDFRAHSFVRRVVVVDNGGPSPTSGRPTSSDATLRSGR